ncbi:CLUMA_CG012333, isoform A [Clunio marinus]|uniref:CLUMA_CG012333, isoform A n=1 Tax=Clunio marinus TaxID=568069 RepID=A0A1J1IHQ7_9DIPT|nr:CLUMA_CG012333, isoform A [Clunio marinus]
MKRGSIIGNLSTIANCLIHTKGKFKGKNFIKHSKCLSPLSMKNIELMVEEKNAQHARNFKK